MTETASPVMIKGAEHAAEPLVGLVLGGGGARGLAHILALEAFDELGVKPSIIAGTSIGAIFGAAYASNIPAEEIRELATETLGKRTEIFKKLFVQRPDNLFDLWNLTPYSKSLMNGEALLDLVYPDLVVRHFENLPIPLKVIASDYYNQETVVLEKGSVITAVAASMALPALFRPVTIGERVLIDGGFTNPLPFDSLKGCADLLFAIDVTGGPGPRKDGKSLPSALEVAFSATQILQNSIVKEKLKSHRPDIVLRPPVSHVGVLAFHRVKEILAETASLKDELKRAVHQAFEHFQKQSA